jgi:capsid protein
MSSDFKPGIFDNLLCSIAPGMAIKRLAAKRILHEFRYDGAKSDHKRGQAPQNMSPNSFDVQRDRLQLMREAEDMERNFAPAKMLNRKFAMYVTPTSYNAATGDQGLDKEIEEYLEEEAFPNCDVTGRYGFFQMLEFGVMGCNRGGDYGWAFQRPGAAEGMIEDELALLPLKIQAVEPDRIGGIYQNVVSNDYVSGLNIGEQGQIDSFRVFHRSMTTNTYDNPIDVPASDFVHLTDPMRIDQYRGVSILATAIQNLRDIYEGIDFAKGKMKLASALTVFTNSTGALAGSGAMDPYATNLFEGSGGAGGLQQDINFGQINHLQDGTDIKFPSSTSPSSEEQWLITQLLKFVAMSYDLPYSFALDAAALGGVSSRLESEMAKATFERFQKVLAPHANRMKNAFLYDAIAKGVFPASKFSVIHKGRWGYRRHPQPDLGKEASAAVNLYEHGLLDPMQHWIENSQDPEDVAASMGRWALIKKGVSDKTGIAVEDIFGSGPSKPLSTSESVTESTSTDETSKAFSARKNFEFDESKHPRGGDGKFGGDSGSSGTSASGEAASEEVMAEIKEKSESISRWEEAMESLPSEHREYAESTIKFIKFGLANTKSDHGLDISEDEMRALTFTPPGYGVEESMVPNGYKKHGEAWKKEFSARKEYREADSSINARIAKAEDAVDFGEEWIADIREGIAEVQDGSNPEALQRLRVELDKANAYLAEHKDALATLKGRRERRDEKKAPITKPAPEARAIKAKKRDDRHALTEALLADGKPEREAYAIAYDIIEKGQFDKSRLPAAIQQKYYP